MTDNVLRVGAPAIWDSFAGPVPIAVLEITGPSGQPTSRNQVRFRLTANRGPYKKGEEFTFSALHVAPKASLIRRSGQYRITRYTVEGSESVKKNPKGRKRKIRRNPMSAQKRREFALRMKRARELKTAGKRRAIKRQIRHGGRHVDPALSTKVLRASRRATQAPGMYNLAALAADKRIAWWTGNGFSLLRGNAQGFESLAVAKKRGSRLERGLVAGVFRSDVSADKARKFLLGKG